MILLSENAGNVLYDALAEKHRECLERKDMDKCRRIREYMDKLMDAVATETEIRENTWQGIKDVLGKLEVTDVQLS